MSRFSTDWLSLREPFDRRARNPDVLRAVGAAFANLPSLVIVDLACGTGSTRRAIAGALPKPQQWRLYDNDLSLLARAAAAPAPAGCTMRTAPLDLVHDVEAALDGAPDLIAASALLDLVSAAWLERFVTECAARNLPIYAALTYNGEAALEPFDARDAEIIAAANRHQARDKGFGPALGATAAAAFIARCKALGLTVTGGASDWEIGPEDREMQSALLTQWARIAQEDGRLDAVEIAGWFTRRREFVARGVSRIRVGHRDVFAQPTGTR